MVWAVLALACHLGAQESASGWRCLLRGRLPRQQWLPLHISASGTRIFSIFSMGRHGRGPGGARREAPGGLADRDKDDGTGLAVADRQVAFPTAVPISHRAVGGSPYTAPPTSPHNPWLLTHAEPHGPGVWKEQGRPGRGVPKKQSPRFFCVFFRSVLAGRPLARAAARDQGVLPPSHCLQTY